MNLPAHVSGTHAHEALMLIQSIDEASCGVLRLATGSTVRVARGAIAGDLSGLVELVGSDELEWTWRRVPGEPNGDRVPAGVALLRAFQEAA